MKGAFLFCRGNNANTGTGARRSVDAFLSSLLAALLPLPVFLAVARSATAGPAAVAGEGLIALICCATLVTCLIVPVNRSLGRPGTRIAIAAGLAALCGSIVHCSGGLPLAHVSGYIALALLLYYRDWKPVAVCCALLSAGLMLGYLAQLSGFPVIVFAVNTEPRPALYLALLAAAGALLSHIAACMGREDEAMRQLAYVDALTDLPNRRHFHETLQQAMHWADRANSRLAVLYLDVDRFKQINDMLGHAAGDQILRAVAVRLAAVLRDGDTVARLGGDEFAVLLNNLRQRHDVVGVAEKIVATLRTPVVLGESSVPASASIGIAIYPDDATEAAALMRCADAALYLAKQSGRDTYRAFAAESIPCFEAHQ